MVKTTYIYRAGKLASVHDWHETGPDDDPIARAMHGKYPPAQIQSIRPLWDDEVAFDHIPTVDELKTAFPDAMRST